MKQAEMKEEKKEDTSVKKAPRKGKAKPDE